MNLFPLPAALLSAGLLSHGLAAHAAPLPPGGGAGIPLVVPVESLRAITQGVGSFGGVLGSFVNGLNDAAQVVGWSSASGDGFQHAFVYGPSGLAAIPGLGAFDSMANAINAQGVIVGVTNTVAYSSANGVVSFLGGGAGSVAHGVAPDGTVVGSFYSQVYFAQHAFVGGLDLGAAGGARQSAATGINASGQVVGWAENGFGERRAFFMATNGNVFEIGPLVAFPLGSAATAINDAGQAVGHYTDLGGHQRAFLFDGTTSKDLGTLGGNSSSVYGLNATGQAVGSSFTAGNVASHAAIWTGLAVVDLNLVAPAGWLYTDARGINAVGQIAGNGVHNGKAEGFLLTPHPDWQGGSGAWNDGLHWNFGGLGVFKGLGPSSIHDVVINPAGVVVVDGSPSAKVRSLVVGGVIPPDPKNDGHPLHQATLDLHLGSTATTHGTRLAVDGVLTGSGVLKGDLAIEQGGTVRVRAGESMLLTGGSFHNAGTVSLNGERNSESTLVVAGGPKAGLAVNQGVIESTYGHQTWLGGLSNQKQMNFGVGNHTVAGALTNDTNGQIAVTGHGDVSFFDAVELRTGSDLAIEAGSRVTFHAAVAQRTGATLSGTGTSHFEGGLSVGASPGFASVAGDAVFGAANVYLAEIGGTAACTGACAVDEALAALSHDRYLVKGQLGFGGVLKLVSWQGYKGQVGQTFDLFDWGSTIGQFSSIDSSGFLLADGATLDLGQLYTLGSISVTAVPEPSTPAMLLAGLLVAGVMRRRRPG